MERVEILKRFNDYSTGRNIKREVGNVLTVGQDITKERAEELVNHPSRIARYTNPETVNPEPVKEVKKEEPKPEVKENLEPPLKAPVTPKKEENSGVSEKTPVKTTPKKSTKRRYKGAKK